MNPIPVLPNMRSLTVVVSLFAAVSVSTAEEKKKVDPYMGDWKGKVELSDGSKLDAAVRMIPLGQGRYKARMFSNFMTSVEVDAEFTGMIRGDHLQMVDVPLTESNIVTYSDEGFTVAGSFVNGRFVDKKLTGTIKGKRSGTFMLQQRGFRSATLGMEPPEGATVLFDGSNLDQWTKRVKPGQAAQPAPWKIVDGELEVNGGGDIVTNEKLGDHLLHLEFRTPYMPHASGQGRGNSGVYLQERYELQVLDSYGLDGADNECGGIYKIAKPAVNMCLPPLEWQTYDINFRAARFDDAGNKTENSKITVKHNGMIIHEDLELPNITGGAYSPDESKPAGLMLQDHGNPVRFRNIWVIKK
ncbi:MAG: hypothetical protein ACI9R3_003627 [Verrucomicrobiales bacterium]|jgi:hypothetical protein